MRYRQRVLRYRQRMRDYPGPPVFIMPVTASHIAERLGISPMTVSRALTGRGRIAEQTRRRIEQAAREMGYRPSAVARATRSGRTGCVGLLMPTNPHHARFGLGLWTAIHDALAEHDLHLNLSRLPDSKLTRQTLPKIVRQWLADGLLINYTHHIPAEMTRAIDDYNIPAVWINAKLAADCVYPDDVAAGRLATRHLLERGHQRVGYVRFAGSGHHSEVDRRAGYEQAMREAGLTPVVTELDTGRYEPEADVAHDPRLAPALAYLDRDDRPGAVVCYSSYTALPLQHAAALKRIEVPRQLGLVSIDDGPVSECGVPLTAVSLDLERVGRVSVEQLLDRIERPDERTPATAIEPVMCIGMT